jgi:crotonobetainyl-CoA:carnitine CoA-transferase CaiB-like acyl-CoA transferase
MAYTDYIAPRFAITALLAALAHLRRTGVGQYIDLSQTECSIHFLGSAILEQTTNGRTVTARGNESRSSAPAGVYPARGEERWIAIDAPDEDCWQALAKVANEGWGQDPRFVDHAARRANGVALDEVIASWTSHQDVENLETRLQAAGVPVHRVSTSQDAFEDPQLEAREHFVWIEHPELGSVPFENARAQLSATPARPGPCPTLGQHNAHVLSEILGLPDDEITELIIAGAIE